MTWNSSYNAILVAFRVQFLVLGSGTALCCLCVYRKNFLQVDLFYKELTQSSVSQQAAYTSDNLLGLLKTNKRCLNY